MKEKGKRKKEKRHARALAGAVVFLTFSFFLFPFSLAQFTTQPAAAPASQPVAQIQKWFDDLASAEPAAREEARVALLGLGRDDLEGLRDVVQKSTPLAPAQATALHEIVVHVYLAGETYPGDPQKGFLGVMLARERGGIIGIPDELEASGAGVLILDCMPGFCGFRWLRPGDLITGVLTAAGGPQPMRISSKEELIDLVKATGPATKLQLQVLRQGRVMQIAIPLDARPLAADVLPGPEEWLNDRQTQAEEYWRKTFVPVAGGTLSRATGTTDSSASSNTLRQA